MRRSDRARAAAACVCVSALLYAGASSAFCRTSSCMEGTPHTAQVCTPAEAGDCGVVLAWNRPCVGFSVQKKASAKVTFAQTEQVLNQAFATWMNAACANGGTPHVHVQEAAPADCAKHEYNQTAGNANIVLYHDDVWPYEGSANTLALTTVTYNLDTGEIYDADMELNSADQNLTVGDANVDFDLLSIVTHESGHFLGLAHSPNIEATMFPDYMEHTTRLRNLSADDIAGICTIYPPGAAIASDCDITPRHGFSPLCAADQPAGGGDTTSNGCCTVAPGIDGGRTYGGLLAALGAMAVAMRRRAFSKRAPRSPIRSGG